jgi:hypothetical protein
MALLAYFVTITSRSSSVKEVANCWKLVFGLDSIRKIEATCFYETSVFFQRATRRYKDRTLHLVSISLYSQCFTSSAFGDKSLRMPKLLQSFGKYCSRHLQD